MGYAQTQFRVFESYLRVSDGLGEKIIQLILKQYASHFINYEIPPSIHSIKDISDVVYTMGVHDRTLENEYDDIRMETKLVLTRFGLTFGVLRFEVKSFFDTLMGFAPNWDYKHTNAIHADNLGVYTSHKILNSSIIGKIHSKCYVIDGSVVNGIREPILLSFIFSKPPGNKNFCEPGTIHCKKLNESVVNTITFYLEDDNH